MLRGDAPADRIVAVQNAQPTRQRLEITPSPSLAFLGAYSYPPNNEAVEYFLTSCWDRVRSAHPAATLLVVGRDPQSIPSYRRKPEGVEFLGFVDDLDSVYRRARVIICPILQGGGTRVKLVEAASFGKPIVSTTIGAEGLGFTSGVQSLLADTPEAFADACVRLLRDDRLAEALSKAAHDYATARFSWDAARALLSSVLRPHLGNRPWHY
jgi:glycosyltransferase involved in cell wall biosynthesis